MKSANEIPRLGFVKGLTLLAASGGGRVDMLSGLRDQYERLGPVVLQVSRPFKIVNLFGPDANRLVLLDREQIFSAKRPWDQIMGRIFTNGLLLRDGADHKHHRKIMHEAFTRPALLRLRRAHGPDDRARVSGRSRTAARRCSRSPRTSSSPSSSRHRSSSAWISAPRRAR